MGVLKPRRKMVSLRLSDDEYDRLIKLSTAKEAHSASDLARAAVCDYLLNHDNHTGYGGPAAGDLNQKVERLEEEVRRLGRLVSSAAAAGR